MVASHPVTVRDPLAHQQCAVPGEYDPVAGGREVHYTIIGNVGLIERVETEQSKHTCEFTQIGIDHEPADPKRPGSQKLKWPRVKSFEDGVDGDPLTSYYLPVEPDRFSIDENQVYFDVGHAA